MKFYIKLLCARNLDALILLADEYVFDGNLEKIIEVTYSYREIDDGHILNETLFEEYLGLSYPRYSLDYLGRRYRYKIQVQLVLIDDILRKVSKIRVCSRSDSLRRGIFSESLEYVKTVLEVSVLGLEFELQKAGEEIKMSKKATDKRICEIEKREKVLFGPKVIDSPEEVSIAKSFLERKIVSKAAKINRKDLSAMKTYLKKININNKSTFNGLKKDCKKNLHGRFLKNKISRKEYRRIFDLVCEFYGLPQRTKITNAGSIYDGEVYLEIPRGQEHASHQIGRILKLITHEIESHYINSYNGKILLGNFRGARNLPKEEGLAIFMQNIFLGYGFDDMIEIPEISYPILFGEILKGDDYENFMRITIDGLKLRTEYHNYIIRKKRNYSFGSAGVQHKDVVYFRGLTEVCDFLKKGGVFKNLFLGKVSFDDLENIALFYDNLSDKSLVVFPIFMSDLIYFYLLEKTKDVEFEFSSQAYYLYLKKKYWFIDIGDFKIINQIDTKWKCIKKILHIFEAHIGED